MLANLDDGLVAIAVIANDRHRRGRGLFTVVAHHGIGADGGGEREGYEGDQADKRTHHGERLVHAACQRRSACIYADPRRCA